MSAAAGSDVAPPALQRRHTDRKVTPDRTTNTPYRIAQIRVCWDSESVGSMSTGYASKAIRLPTLLAAYRKYGSRAERSSVAANHRCIVEAVVASTTNGRPTATTRTATIDNTGLPCGSGIHPAGRPNGRSHKGKTATTR